MTRAMAAVLTASSPQPVEMTATLGVASQVDFTRRIISGIVVPPPGKLGMTSLGPTMMAARAVSWSDLTRVKLLREHQHQDVLGHAIELRYLADESLFGRFYVLPGPNGDRALQEASEHKRDGLSVGLRDLVATRSADGVAYVTSGLISETSQVVMPAWDDSRITEVIASQPERLTPVPCTHCGAIHAPGQQQCDQAQLQANLQRLGLIASAQPNTPPTPPATPAPVAIQPETVLTMSASSLADYVQTMIREGNVHPALTPPNQAPANQADQAPAGIDGLSLQALTAQFASAYRGETSMTELRAALSDIVPADVPNATVPVYLAELWDGSPYVRKYINNAVTLRPLPRAFKFIGHKWVTKPEVDDYAGNKADVPSNEIELVPVEVTPKRLAGAHDVDRALFDLGDPAFVQSYFEAMTESYARKSDARAATQGWTDAAALTGTPFATVLAGVIQGVVELATLGEAVEYVALSPALIAELFNITNMEAPAYFGGSFQLGNQGDGALGGLTWFTTPGLPARGFMLGQKSAQRYHEFTPPIRVQADNIAQGGIDLGVFGYYASYQRNGNQVRKGTVTAPGA